MDSLFIGKIVMGASYSAQKAGVKAIPSDVGLAPSRFCENTCLTGFSRTLVAYEGSWPHTQELRMHMQA